MTLRETIIADATTVFTSVNDFAETVTYRPHQGSSRCVNAVVIRQVAETISDEENRVVPVFEVHVINDSCKGIASCEINLGGDRIDISARVGNTPLPRSIVQVTDQDEGMMVLVCR